MKYILKIVFFLAIFYAFIPLLSPLQAQLNSASTEDSSLTNIILHNEIIIPTNPLEFYEQSTEANFIRRTEVIFFISIPFAFLLTNFFYALFPYASTGSAFFNGVRGNQSRINNFFYSRDRLPLYLQVSDPFYVFIWTSSTVWPAVIAINSFIERAIDPKLYQSYKSRIINNRPHLQRVFKSSF